MSSDLTFIFTKEVPKHIKISGIYLEPEKSKKAEYNSGEGWMPCPAEKDGYARITLPIHSNQISFRGDWRGIGGRYGGLFKYTFSKVRGVEDVIMLGTLEHDANNIPCGYRELFFGCDGIIYMRDNPIPKLKGILAEGILRSTFNEMSSLTSLPEGFLDMSEMHGDPECRSLYYTCYHMGASSPYIFKLGPDIKLSRNGIFIMLSNTWARMKTWKGTVLWGDKVLFDEVVPDRRVSVVYGCSNMIGYDKIHENWK